jgi:arylsulfatase A-like enzyme
VEGREGARRPRRRIRHRGLTARARCAALAALLALFPACADDGGGAPPPPAPVEDDPRPDVVVILLDTLRPDAMQTYGAEKETSPFLLELGSTAAVFERALSTSSWTAPAVTSVMTGLYPTEHGIIEGFLAFLRREQKGGAEVLPLNRLPEDLRTMPQLFSAAGYRTWGIATNLNVGPEIGLDRGFDRFEQIRKGDAAEVAAQMGEWRDDLLAPGAPDFVYLHFMDVHEPYHKREPWYEKQRGTVQEMRERYDSELRYLDEQLRGLYEDFGWAEDTLLVVISDHGEEFREHGQMGHEFTLYDELNRIVLLVRPPGGMEGRRVPTSVSLIDVLPTTLALAGVEVPPGLEGMSLAPLIQGQRDAPAAFERRTLFAHRFQVLPEPLHLWAAVRGSEKLIAGPSGMELYDLAADPGEQQDLFGASPERAEALRQALAEFRQRGFRQVEKVEVVADEALSAELAELGYLEGGEDED